MKEIVSIYKKSVDKNLKDINSILKKLDMKNPEVFSACKKALKTSSANVVKKWLSGRKYSRTVFVKQAFGKFYPKKYLETSIFIDAMINILDDLIDEEIDDKEKILYVLEILRTFSLYNLQKPNPKIQTAFGYCFNRLISVPFAENIYQKKIRKEKIMKKIIEYSAEILKHRATDIDVFNEIALMNYKNKKVKEKIKKIGKIFRASTIFKKDIEDINYDKKMGMETVVTLMSSRKDYKFSGYTENLLNYFSREANKIKSSAMLFNKQDNTPITNYYRMLERNKEKIIKLVGK